MDGYAGSDNLTGGAGDDFFRLAQNQTAGDVITDFAGAGASGGDSLHFEGFGAGAALSNAGDDWTVTYSGGSETFEITGVTDLTELDYSFA